MKVNKKYVHISFKTFCDWFLMYKTYPVNFLHLTALVAQWQERLHRKRDIRDRSLVATDVHVSR